MQGSLDSMVIWLPLVPIDQALGALEVIFGTHLKGLICDQVEDGFGRVDNLVGLGGFEPIECGPGDILVFSSFLVHQSGTNVKDEVRWSCHFRYNNLDERSFIARGFPHPYIYRPQDELLHEGFPSPEEVHRVFDELSVVPRESNK